MLFSGLFKRRRGNQPQSKPKMAFDSEPDLPIGFGYKCAWIAVKSVDTDSVLEKLQLKDIQVSNWRTGIQGAYEGYYFVTPPVQGWTLIINALMPDISTSVPRNPLSVIAFLSQQYGEAYYFGTHRVVDYHAWAKAVDGEVVRAYGYLGESGQTLINEGDLTSEEEDNDLWFTGMDEEPTDETTDELKLPYEEDVIQISSLWTLNPLMQEVPDQVGTGYVGT